MNKRNIVLVIFSVIFLIAITFVMYKQSVKDVEQPIAEQTPIAQEEVQKTDFGSELPSDFPTDIPTEEGVEVEQSYSLNYEGQKQLTIVFPSTKTVKNYFFTFIVLQYLNYFTFSFTRMNDDRLIYTFT